MAKRPNKLGVSSGFKGTGKTTDVVEWLESYAYRTDGTKGRKGLLFDTNMEYTTENLKKAGKTYHIKTILAEQVPLFIRHPKIEICRVLPVKRDGTIMKSAEKKQMAWHLLSTFKNGVMVLEDPNNYVLNFTNEEEFVGQIMNNAHRNQDIMINLQSLNMINPIILRNLDFVRMRYQSDDISSKFESKTELFSIAKFILDVKYAAGNQFFSVLVLNHQSKIKGVFNKSDFALGCNKYLDQNPRLIKHAKTRIKTDSDIKARAEAIRQLFKYYGN